jgi:hypothetical protein
LNSIETQVLVMKTEKSACQLCQPQHTVQLNFVSNSL